MYSSLKSNDLRQLHNRGNNNFQTRYCEMMGEDSRGFNRRYLRYCTQRKQCFVQNTAISNLEQRTSYLNSTTR